MQYFGLLLYSTLSKNNYSLCSILLLCCMLSKRDFIKADTVSWLVTVLTLPKLIHFPIIVLYVVYEELMLI